MDPLVIEHQIERRRKRRRGIIALLSALAALTLGAGSFSLAQFTDTDSSTWSFTTGTIDINSNPAVLTAVTAMMPGGTAADSLTISNDGTADLRYAMSTVATNALGDELDLEVRELDLDTVGCNDFDGAVVVAGGTALNGASFGDPTQGADAGDRVLTAGNSEVLCFQVSLPLTTLDAFQGATSAVTFTFDAEQTANNP
jgi:Camelysin metallo-endopeptidase